MQILTLNKPLADAIDDIEQAIKDQGMWLLCHINGQANAAKIGETVPPVRILEVFRPELAVRVWRAHQPAGIEIPVRMYIHENPAGQTVIQVRSLRDAFEKYESVELEQVGVEADATFTRILYSLENRFESVM